MSRSVLFASGCLLLNAALAAFVLLDRLSAQEVVKAESTSTGNVPNLTVVTARIGSDKDAVLLFREVDNFLEPGKKALSMTMYEPVVGGQKGETFLLSSRLVDYDVQLQDYSSIQATKSHKTPVSDIKKAVEEAKKIIAEREAEREKQERKKEGNAGGK